MGSISSSSSSPKPTNHDATIILQFWNSICDCLCSWLLKPHVYDLLKPHVYVLDCPQFLCICGYKTLTNYNFHCKMNNHDPAPAESESNTGDVSSAQAVLLGALAPGVNVGIFTLYSLIVVSIFFGFCEFFHWFCVFVSGSYLDYFKVDVFVAGSLSCFHAGFSILFQWFMVGAPCWVSCSNLCYPLLASQLVISFLPEKASGKFIEV